MSKALLTAVDLAVYASIAALTLSTGLMEGVGPIGLALGLTVTALSTYGTASVLRPWLAGRLEDAATGNGWFASMAAVMLSVITSLFFASIYVVLMTAVAMYALIHHVVALCRASKEDCHLLLNPSHFHDCYGERISYERYLKMKEGGRL